MNKPVQRRLWEIEDLPLFSGAGARAREVIFMPQEATGSQPCLFACRLCGDTGRLGRSFCLCPAGRALSLAEPRGSPLKDDAFA